MATQTGSIDLTASNAVKLAAEAGWQSDLDDYYTKSEIDVTVDGINSTVSTKVGEDEVISSINQSSESVSINASKINLTGAVTISDLSSDAQSATLNSNISVGGRNLLTGTGDWSGGVIGSGAGTVSGDVFSFEAHDTLAWHSIGISYPHTPFPSVDGKTLTLSFDYRSDDFSDTSGDHYVYINAAASATIDGGRSKYRQLSTDYFGGVYVPTAEWQHGDITFTLSESLFNAGSGECNYFYIQFYNHTLNSYQLRHVKLEVGNVATDWSPAPEDLEAYADETAYLTAKPNLAPIGSAEFSDVYNATTNPDGYWRATVSEWLTQLDDGWIHVYRDNSSGTSATNSTLFRPSASPSVFAGKVYTILTEIRNNASTGTGTNDFYLQQISNNQFWGNTIGVVIDDDHVTTGTGVSLLTCGQSYVLRSYRIADTDHLTAGTPSTEMFRYNFRAAPGSVLNFDFRMSVYEGIYDGPYKPYSGAQLLRNAAKTATNYITADSTGIKIHMSGNSTTYQHQSSTATTYYVSGNKRTVVSADGLEVFDGTYGSEESVAAFGTVARLGKATGNKVIADSTGVHIYDVQGSQVAAFGQAPGELTTTMLSDEPEIGTSYQVPSDAISDISIMLDDQTLVEDTDYTLSSGIVTLLESATVTSILNDSGSSDEESSEDVDAHSLTCEYRASSGVGLAIGASVTRPGLDVAERAVFRHPSFVEATHGTANADTGYRASRTDTGIQVFCGIGIGGVNHGVYSHVLNRWLINADRSAVHVAPHTVTDGNINIRSKYVYATTPSASKGDGWGHGLQYADTAGALVGVVKAYSLTTGEKGIQLSATRKVGSTTVNNGVMLGVDSSGNRKLTFNGGGRTLWRQALGFDSGYVSASYGGSDNAPKNAYRDIPITFNFTHTYAPHVVVSFATGSTGVTMGGLSLSAFDVTTTGCKIRIYNNTNDARNPPLYWVAID